MRCIVGEIVPVAWERPDDRWLLFVSQLELSVLHEIAHPHYRDPAGIQHLLEYGGHRVYRAPKLPRL